MNPTSANGSRRRVRGVVTRGVLLATALLLMTGCSWSASKPSYSTVRAEAEAAMTRVTDLLPAASRVEDLSSDVALHCDGDGASYTGHWSAYPPAGFDTSSFVSTLAAQLADDFQQRPSPIDTSFEVALLLASDQTAVLLTVTDTSAEAGPSIDLLAISRCGTRPAPSK